MVDGDGRAHFLNYRFWHDPQNYSGIVDRYETPIEWQIYVFID